MALASSGAFGFWPAAQGVGNNILCGDASELWVSPSGSDTGAGSAQDPFRTILRARDEVRSKIANGCPEDLTVWIHPGTYWVGDKLNFNLADSRPANTTTYSGIPGLPRPQLLGADAPLGGWQFSHMAGPDGTVPVMKAELGVGVTVQSLYALTGTTVERLTPARTPNTSWDHLVSVICGEVLYPASSSIPDFEPAHVALVSWGTECNSMQPNFAGAIRAPIDDHDGQGNRITLVVDGAPGWEFEDEAPFFLEGAVEFIDQPGEWALTTDVVTGMTSVALAPLTPGFQEQIVLPTGRRVIRVQGSPTQDVRNLVFRSLELAITDRPTSMNGFEHLDASPGDPYAGITLRRVNGIEVSDCHVHHVGVDGLTTRPPAQQVTVNACLFEDIGSMGLTAWGQEGAPVSGHVVTDTYFRDLGQEFAWGGGIVINHCAASTFEYNTIETSPRYGIYLRAEGSQNNVVAFNEISDVMRSSGDVGGITIWKGGASNWIENNVVRDCVTEVNALAKNIGPFGIYVDGGTHDSMFTKNIVFNITLDDTGSPLPATDFQSANYVLKGIHNELVSNISVGAPENGVETHLLTKFNVNMDEIPQVECNRSVSNIFYNLGDSTDRLVQLHVSGEFYKASMNGCGLGFPTCAPTFPRSNAYFAQAGFNLVPFDPNQSPPAFGFRVCNGDDDRTLSEWVVFTGYENGSVEGDPLFMNAAAGDFALKIGSPAIDLDFCEPSPVVGVQNSSF